MSKYVTEKRIIIESYGTLHTLGSIHGPVLTPFKLECFKILGLLQSNKKVIEILDDGTRVVLSKDNYNTDNTIVTPKEIIKPRPEVIKPVEKAKVVVEPVINNTAKETTVAAEVKVETPKVETPDQNREKKEYNNFNKKNK